MKAILAPQNIDKFKFESNSLWSYLYKNRSKESFIIETKIAPLVESPSKGCVIAIDEIGEDIFKQWSKYLSDPEHILHMFLKCVRESRRNFFSEPEYYDGEGNYVKEKTDMCMNIHLCRHQCEIEQMKNIDLLHCICTKSDDCNDIFLMNGLWKVNETFLIAGREELFVTIEQYS